MYIHEWYLKDIILINRAKRQMPLHSLSFLLSNKLCVPFMPMNADIHHAF